MKKFYVCYDGVDCEITRHKTEEQALEKLKELVSENLDFDEWVEGIENSFVAEITHKIDSVKIENDSDDEEDKDDMEYFDMVIKQVSTDGER